RAGVTGLISPAALVLLALPSTAWVQAPADASANVVVTRQSDGQDGSGLATFGPLRRGARRPGRNHGPRAPHRRDPHRHRVRSDHGRPPLLRARLDPWRRPRRELRLVKLP